MNDWQAVRQVKYLLQQATWEDAATVIFAPSSVIVTAGAEVEAFANRRMPLALVRVGGAQSDPDHGAEYPEIQQQELTVTLVAAVQGDRHGESAIVGAGRASQNTSAGRGVLELEEEVLAALLRADDDDGLRLSLWTYGESDVRQATMMGDLAVLDVRLRARVTTDRSYRALRTFTATGNGSVSGTVAYPATRFDTYQLVIRRASGATAPASATAGTGVTLGSSLPTSWTDSPGAGTWSYAAFLAYDEFGDGSSLRYSPALTQESVVVS